MSEAFVTSDRRQTQRAGTLVWLISVVLAAMLIGALVATFMTLRRDVDRLSQEVDSQDVYAVGRDADIETLRQQLQSIGVEPDVAGPLLGGAQGPPGEDGEDGRDGLTIIGPSGLNGTDGTNGADGVDGRDGRDGQTIIGPQGADGPQGPPGQTVAGPQGPPGAEGASPASFTFIAGGVTYSCTDPDGDRAYECPATVP